jgi:hypothetical protein
LASKSSRPIGPDGQDLRAVAHDPLVLRQGVPKVVWLEGETLRREAEKRGFETRPFRIDHAPGETRRKNALRHVRQDPVVEDVGDRSWVQTRRQ